MQMSEDETFARSLQEQSDREDQIHQEASSSRHSHNLLGESYVGLDWNSPSTSMSHWNTSGQLRQPLAHDAYNSHRRLPSHLHPDLLNDRQRNNYEVDWNSPSTSMSHWNTSGQLRQPLAPHTYNSHHRPPFHLHPDLLNDRQRNNYEVGSYVGLDCNAPSTSMSYWNSSGQLRQPLAHQAYNSHRRLPSHLHPDLLDDTQGNNYEALLAFEELQGTVVATNTLSKRDIQRLPTKVYDPAHNAGKTECRICFGDDYKGEKLRILPCLHDYHVKCVDRWLKASSTCPICRADVSEHADFS